MKKILFLLFPVFITDNTLAQTLSETDSLKLEQLMGYFFVFEPRPVIDLTNTTFDLIFSSIIGKALGGGFNLIALAEFPTNETTINNSGILYPFGSNKNF